MIVDDRAQRLRLGPILREARERQGLTQKQLGNRSNLSPDLIDMLERGETSVGTRLLVRHARALQVSLRELLGP